MVAVVQTTMIYDYIDDNMPDWARKAVQAAMDCGVLVGDETVDWDYLIRTLGQSAANTVADCTINDFKGGVMPPLFF